MTSVAVYNEFWETGGGGEMFCGGIAQALAEAGHDVTILAHRRFDVDALSERLSLDLSGCDVAIVDTGASAVSTASADYGFFVNGSYLSPVVNRADHGLYVVHFPSRPWGRDPGPLSRLYQSRFGSTDIEFEWGEGFHEPDGGSGTVWTSDEATIFVTSHADTPTRINLLFGRSRDAAAGPADIRVEVDGEEQARVTAGGGATSLVSRVRNRLPEAVPVEVAPDSVSTVTIRSNTFVPEELGLGSDRRRLGVRFHGIQVVSPIRSAVTKVLPSLNHHLTQQNATGAFLRSYDQVASNSEFTRAFVEDWWGLETSPVLYPPVHLRPRSNDKTPTIAAVGRFFEKDAGHSKKQLELVKAFRRLLGTGVEGWTLELVGGVDANARGYFEEVERAAAGLPIRFHANAVGSVRDEVLAKASLFWHATGLGEDEAASPELMEHFGISTVEAMSTGAVPVVFGGGGQNEIVQPGTGFRFTRLDDLVTTTRRLILDDDERARVSAAAAARAQDFGFDRFTDRLNAIVASILEADA